MEGGFGCFVAAPRLIVLLQVEDFAGFAMVLPPSLCAADKAAVLLGGLVGYCFCWCWHVGNFFIFFFL